MDTFLLTTISLIALLTVASYASVLAKKLNFPFSIFLFIIGITLVIIGRNFGFSDIFTNLTLSKDLVFFIFLPTLIFESAFNMSYQKLLREAVPITSLAIGSLLISTAIIGIGFKWALLFFGFDIPYTVSFLFGAIISATDPVAVLSIFKEYGVPKRIMYLFEGESLFNDGTAVAIFLIILGVIEAGGVFGAPEITQGMISFFSMILGGIAFGLFMGLLFSKMIQWVKDSWAELTLTLILAHTTFILAELISEHFVVFKVSAIIATTVAALTLGNYGRYKISNRVREMMHITWGYFAFISNSLIFLLMGMLIGGIDFKFNELFIPISVAILIVIAARAISVFVVLQPLNKFLAYPIPWKWQKLLSWGSLRGAIAITMLLFISKDLQVPGWTLAMSVQEFLSVIVISCIVFTLLIKATSIGKLIKQSGLADLSKSEEFTLHQIKDIIDKSMLKRLGDLHLKQYVPDIVTDTLIHKYEADDAKEIKEIHRCKLKQQEFNNLLQRYSLGIERRTILDAFERREVDEFTLKQILNKIESQFIRIEMGKSQLKSYEEKKDYHSFWERFRNNVYYRNNEFEQMKQQYTFYRSRAMIAENVLTELKKFREQFSQECCSAFQKVIKQYENWHDIANKKMYDIADKINDPIYIEEARLLNNHLVYIEEEILERMYSKHIITGKVYALLKKSLRDD